MDDPNLRGALRDVPDWAVVEHDTRADVLRVADVELNLTYLEIPMRVMVAATSFEFDWDAMLKHRQNAVLNLVRGLTQAR